MTGNKTNKPRAAMTLAMAKLRAAKARTKQRLMLCFARLKIFWNSIKATISRLLYIIHCLLTVWQVTVVLGAWYWVVSAWLTCMLIEAAIVVFIRKGVEWKWFQPCILIYLMVELPSIWLLELERTSQVQIERNATNVILNDLLAEYEGVGNSDLFGLDISHAWWTLLLEQSMMVLIIIARWLMPKGDMSRDQLSALLLYYLGTASDLVDFFSVLSEDDKYLLNTTFVYTVLATWSWSMFQFVFVVTMTTDDNETKKPPDDVGEEEGELHRQSSQENLIDYDEMPKTCFQRFKSKLGSILESEAWAITVSMVMQDGPFAVVRSLCLFYWGIRTYTNYFFTFKNILILCLQSYRLVSVYEEYKKKKTDEEQKKELDRKTHQVSVNMAAVTAFKRAGRRHRKHSSDSDEEPPKLTKQLSDVSEIDSAPEPEMKKGKSFSKSVTFKRENTYESDSDYDSPTESNTSPQEVVQFHQSQSPQVEDILRSDSDTSVNDTDSNISCVRQETETDIECDVHNYSGSNGNTPSRDGLSVTCVSCGQINFVKSPGVTGLGDSADSRSSVSTRSTPPEVPEPKLIKTKPKAKHKRSVVPNKSLKRSNKVSRGHMRLEEESDITEVSV